MPTRIEWHELAIVDLEALDGAVRQRVVDAIGQLRSLDDPRQRLIAYTASLKGFWKLRVGDYRVVCELRRTDGPLVIVVHVVHRGRAYLARSVKTVRRRSDR